MKIGKFILPIIIISPRHWSDPGLCPGPERSTPQSFWQFHPGNSRPGSTHSRPPLKPVGPLQWRKYYPVLWWEP